MPEKTTHYLVPASMRTELRDTADRTGRQQSDMLRGAVGAMLKHWKDARRLPEWPAMPSEELVSVVCRLPEHVLLELRALAERTRVHQSVWLRYAHHLLLEKYRRQEVQPEAAA